MKRHLSVGPLPVLPLMFSFFMSTMPLAHAQVRQNSATAGSSIPTSNESANDSSQDESDLSLKSDQKEIKRYDDAFFVGGGTKVVMNKFYDKEWRHELYLHGAILPFGSLYFGYGGGFSYTFHFSDNWAWEVVHGQYFKANFTNFVSELEVQNNAQVGTNKPKWAMMTSGEWNGAYGKLRLLGTIILRFDLFALAGLGVVKTDRGTEIGGSFGGGARAFLGRYFAFRLEIRDFIHHNTLNPGHLPGNTDPTTGRPNKEVSEIKNNFVILAGISVFLPGFERIEDE